MLRFFRTFAVSLALFVIGAAVPALAQEDDAARLQVPIPAANLGGGQPLDERAQAYLAEGKVQDLAQYIGIVYDFLIATAGFVAAVMIIIGGFQYVTSGGDPSKVKSAQSRIRNAMMGLILIFGAYLLLKTINPALVNLQPLNIRAVKTEIIALPWCEDLTGQGAPTPVQGLQTCGAVGEYRPSSSAESVFPCIYRGSAPVIAKQADFRAGALAEQALGAPARQDGPTNGMTDERLIHTCMQRGGLDQQSLLATARADQAYRAAMTLPCAALTAPVAKAMGYPELNGACKAWQDATTAFQTVDNPRQNAQKNYDGVIWSYCAKSTVNDTCVQSDAYCHKVDNNNDDGARGGCEEEDDCGCQGYDESPSVAFTEKKDIVEGDPGSGTTWVTGSYETITVEDSGPEDFPSHLGPICAWNPCKDYVGPNGKKNFANGCSGPNISTYVWGVRAVTADCRNK